MGLIRILVLALVAALAYTLFRRMIGAPKSGRERPDKDDERLARLVQDPQCQIYVDPQEAVRRKVPDGELFFCSETCAEAYMGEQEANPGG